ncbi:response regulator [Bosea caraganae]|uniref:histidine kinase n=1 Tax=Bosea caraganae TaxID=2763117 RepID=A0A370L9Y4_9HYPH|nr:ATP-binding protein [Bosea caraganae]RDJ21986.1 response regulator [Bosea caraganae]RDJ27980.1 response regulator [Bosea caraganae]
MSPGEAMPGKRPRGRLARKYAVFVGSAICIALGLNAVIGTFFAFADQRALVVRVQQEQAQAAAGQIGSFVTDIMRQLDWVSQSGVGSNPGEDRRLDGLRLLRQVPAILELRQIGRDGRELLGLSRFEHDRVGSGADWSADPGFQTALAQGQYYGEVAFRRGSEPYMVLAKRVVTPTEGVVLATVNLTFIRDLVSRLKVGEAGRAYVVARSGRLIAHPDLRFVLRNTNLGPLLAAHEQAGAQGGTDARASGVSIRDMEGRPVLSVMTKVPNLDWSVVVDLPESEAFAPIYASILRSLGILVAALVCAVLASIGLSRRLVAPIRALSDGAARIGRGQLDERIAIRTGDELQELGDQFNLMAGRLQESRAVLEDKVLERTAALAAALDQASAGQRAAEQARHVAEEATRAKSRFLAVVGHDIRTPLSGVLGVLEILDRRRMSRSDRRLVEMAAASGDTLINLANATLDLSRLEAGTESLELRDYEPGALLTATVTLMQPAAARKDIALKLGLGSAASMRLHGDAGKVNRIVLNLLRNAISFTDRGEIVLAAAVAGDTFTIIVRDTGIGIEPAMQQKIFQDFVQVDPETGRRSGGVGLGLAICTKLTELMGGTLSVVSAVGAGSTFTVRLPAIPARAAAQPEDRVAVERALRVLVVDDEPVTREVARIMIDKAGHRALAAASGEAAVTLLEHEPVDLVLLDMQMGGMDGIATAAAIRAQPDIVQPEIVMLTADVSPETMRLLREAGLTKVLSKPATSSALLQVLGGGARRAEPGGAIVLSSEQAVDALFFETQGQLIGDHRLDQLVLLFATVSLELLQAMRSALEAADRTGLARAAHQLGSSAGALGLGRVLARATGLERDAPAASFVVLAQDVAGLEGAREEALADLARRSAGVAKAVPGPLGPDQALRSATMPSL